MKIAVTSQNGRTITGRAGKCHKFWIFHIEERSVHERELLELPPELSFHNSALAEGHPLTEVRAIITGGMGDGMSRRLKELEIEVKVTEETDPEMAVEEYLDEVA